MHPNNAAIRIVELLEELVAGQVRFEAKLDVLLPPPADKADRIERMLEAIMAAAGLPPIDEPVEPSEPAPVA